MKLNRHERRAVQVAYRRAVVEDAEDGFPEARAERRSKLRVLGVLGLLFVGLVFSACAKTATAPTRPTPFISCGDRGAVTCSCQERALSLTVPEGQAPTREQLESAWRSCSSQHSLPFRNDA